MKIEKLNDRQIRCTLRKSDLASRHLKISELAYGSAKAKELFKDIMQQASSEFGFEADDLPLMIEAIPVSSECIVLIVTKVEEPEELDTRFSKFSSTDDDDDDPYSYDDDYDSLTDLDSESNTLENLSASDELDIPDSGMAKDVLNIFNTVKDLIEHSLQKASDSPLNVSTPEGDFTVDTSTNSMSDSETNKHVVRIFSFENFDTVSEAANTALLVYNDKNSLYKDESNSKYYLVIEKCICNSISFNKVCNLLSEYGTKEQSSVSRANFFKEHYTCICKDRALQVMGKV
ncbi:MAG: adaptor protein MecA [Lachnospira sp.]|nr:adaptor protein MecA [Lachnospira sp.]